MAGTKRSGWNRFCCFSSSASDEEGQDHPASADPSSLPSANVNTTETLPGPPKPPEAPIPVSSNVVPVKYEIEQHVDPNLDVSGTHQCDKAPVSESQNILRKSEGEDLNAHFNVSGFLQGDEPSSSGSSNVPVKSEGKHVDVNPKVSEAPSSSSSTGAIDNTTGPPKRSEAPIPGSSNVVTPRKDEDEDGQDHPASAGPRSPPSAIDNTTETLPGPPKRSEAPIPGSSDVVTPRKDEIEQHVDPNPDVSRTHQCAKAPLSKSQNIPRKSGGEDVNAHPNVSGPTQCDEPSSSGSSNLPVKSAGEHVDVNPNVSEAPSSSSSTGATKSDVIRSIKHIGQADGKKMDVNLDELVDHISKLLKLREKEMLPNKKASNPSNFPWPEGFKKLNAILSWGTDLKNLTQLLSSGLDFASKLKEVISGPVTTILKDIGQASVVTAGLLVVAYTLERFHDLSDNKDGCWGLIKEMSRLASVVKELDESPKGTFNVIEEATTLVVEGAITCCTQLSHSGWKSFLLASKDKADLSGITQKLNSMYLKISVDIGIRNLSAIEGVLASNENQAKMNSANFERVLASNDYRAKRNSANFGRVLASNDDQAKKNSANFEHVLGAIESMRNPPVSRIYPDYAVGIDQSIEDVLSLLECESAQRAVTVILHGFGGMGKTTLADAVFSRVRGYRYSHVQLFEDIDSKPNITELQKKILKDLMGPEKPVPDIRKYQDGQGKLGEKLEKMEAFIYIDNVLEGAKLKDLLPEDMSRAKKVRLLLTARNEEVKNACPRPCTNPKIYPMQEIQRQAALLILKREIKDGINESQFNDIIDTCGGIPLMLKLAAPFIGRAHNKQKAYSTLVLQKNKWPSEEFGAMHCAFAYDALPHDCIEPFLDICSYFKGWDWEAVQHIVGKKKLKMLESRALVTRATNDVASVHDVILTLARQKSEYSEGKEVRLAFTSATKLKEFIEAKGADGIKGIWLSDKKDGLEISAATLDLMSKSLRVLRLGDLANVEGECRETFKELVFFEAKALQLPFHDLSKFTKLRYLSYQPKHELKLSKMPKSLRHMEFDGRSLSDAFQIYPSDLQQLEHLRILRLLKFSMLKSLPKKLGDQVKGLHELSLLNCGSITKLPDSISELQSLRILKMDGCSSLTKLPVDFGSLSSLRELHLHGCSDLEALPVTAEKLSSLTLLDLSACTRLLNLPPRVGNFTRLVELNLEGCKRLESIPEGIGNLTGLVKLNLDSCRDLKSIPEGIRNLTRLVELKLSYCSKLKSIPKGIGELKLLRALGAIWCETLTELPDGLCNLSFITHLLFQRCVRLEKLPDRFGQLASLKAVYFTGCRSLQKLPESFGQLKNLEVLDLGECDNLRELCNDFHCLSSLQNLDLRKCRSLKKLPLDFHCLTSLQRLDLSDCEMLEGKSMDHVVKMNRLQLQVVHIKRSKQLVDRWAEIQRDGGGSWSFTVISGQDLSRVEKENIQKSLLLELDGLRTNRRGEQFHLSPLPPNTLILVLWDHQPYIPYIPDWRDFIEEMIDETQIKMIYIGPDFDKFSTKVKDNIFVVDVPTTRAAQMYERVHLTLDLAPEAMINKCLQIDTRMQAGDEYRPCWRLLRRGEMEEFVVSNCKRYLLLKQLQVERDEELERDEKSSNIELLTELFAPQGDETTPVFQKNESSVQQDPTANSEVKATCGVDKLEGKTILLEMRPPHSFSIDIRLPSLKEMYLLEKERLNFEIISIPLLRQGEVSSDVFDVYKQFSREVPWLVLRTTITREVQYFLAKHCTESKYECEKCYPSINWVIDPNGRITIYRPPISPGDMRDRGEVFKVFFNYLESQSYQLRWGVKAPLTTLGKIEEVRKNEWQQVKNMSALEFLFNHLESVSVQVKSLMRQGKFICFFAGSCYGEPWSMRSAMEQFRDSIHFINVSYTVYSFRLDSKIDKEYYYPLENTTEMEGTSLLNLSRHETVRFIMRLHHLKEEIKGMDLSDKQLCELKTILHSLLFRRSFTFFNEVGKMVGALEGEKIISIFYPADRRDKVQRLINLMLKEGGKEMHDEDSSLIRKIHTASASAVEQQNADVYFDALRDYISHLWGVQLYQLCKFNQEGKKRSPPRVTWPTWSRGLGRLKNLLSEGANEDWVKDVISRHSEEDEEDALDTVIKCLVQDIEEAEWAVAGLLAVADLLERFETVPPSSREEWLFVLEEMFRLAQYSKQFNQKAERWRRMKCRAIVVILRYSIICCRAIDPSKFEFAFAFALGRWEGSSADEWLEEAEKDLREECDTLAQTMTEDPDNESGSLANLDCYKLGFDLWPEGEGEGGPSSEYKRSASCPCPDLCFPDLWLESEGEGGLSSEYKRSASCPCPDLCFPDLWLESEEEGGPSESEEEGEDEGGPSEGEDEGGPSSEYKRSASFPELWLESEDEGGPSSE